MTRAQVTKLDRLVARDHRLAEWWSEEDDDIWISLNDGYNFEGCSCIHAETVEDAILDVSMIEKGYPY